MLGLTRSDNKRLVNGSAVAENISERAKLCIISGFAAGSVRRGVLEYRTGVANLLEHLSRKGFLGSLAGQCDAIGTTILIRSRVLE